MTVQPEERDDPKTIRYNVSRSKHKAQNSKPETTAEHPKNKKKESLKLATKKKKRKKRKSQHRLEESSTEFA